MISNFKFQISNSSKGTTLVELVVVIFMVALFSMIMISDFPKIMRNSALSRATYKLAQDLRRVEDMALSGATIKNNLEVVIAAKGYGIYFTNRSVGSELNSQKYIMWADADGNQLGNSFQMCDSAINPSQDCIIDKVNLSKENSDVYIKSIRCINTINGTNSSLITVQIYFSPPSPTIAIAGNNGLIPCSQTTILLGLKSDVSASRSVLVNTSGLISVQ